MVNNITCASVLLLVFLLNLTFLRNVAHADDEVRQVIVIHRHGARYPLDKDPFDPSDENIEDRTDVLYREGEGQLRALGEYVKANYFSGKIADSPYRVVSYSSDLRRTLLSSRAFLSGLLGANQNKVATLMFEPSDEDWIIRGYALCPRIKTKFVDFTKTSEYKEWKSQHEEDISTIAEKMGMPKDKRKIENIFNIYDRFITMAYENKTSTLDNDQRKTLVDVANWYESRKFIHLVHDGKNIAGGVLKKVVDWMTVFHELEDDKILAVQNAKVIEVSAHYPTLLTLLSTLNEDATKIEFPADQIPSFGAAIIVELRGTTAEKSVKFQWYPGNTTDSKDINTSPIKIRRKGCDDDKCNLSHAFKATKQFKRNDFCDQCATGSTISKACLSSENSPNTRSVSPAVYIAIAFFIGIVVSALAAFMYARSLFKTKLSSTTGRCSSGDNGDVGYDPFDDPLTNTTT